MPSPTQPILDMLNARLLDAVRPPLQIITSRVVGEPFADWSGVRSPGRARRRLKQGHRQNIVTSYRSNGTALHDKKRNIIYCHPADYDTIKRNVENANGPR